MKDYFVFLGEIGAKLNASDPELNRAMEILQHAKQKRIASGRNPRVLAAAALYVAPLSLGRWS